MKTLIPCFMALSLLQLTVVALGGIADQSLSGRQSEAFQFSGHRNGTIRGTIWLPDSGTDQNILAVLVHGDGPQDRTSGGGYNPLVNTLLDQGITVASWDKPGVGESDGSWLDQSMVDRADETKSAVLELKRRFGDVEVGAIGFSQAGWVLPRLSTEDGLDYLVLIGPAINWQDQGDFFGTKRMEAEGKSPDEIQESLIQDRATDDTLFNAPTFPNGTVGLTENRWTFIKRNRQEDSTVFIVNLTIPILAVWGEDDLNVNATQDAETYRRSLTVCPHKVVLIPEATHGLQKLTYNYQLSDQWPYSKQVMWYEEGRLAYAEGALEVVVDWILRDHEQEDPLYYCAGSSSIPSSGDGYATNTISSLSLYIMMALSLCCFVVESRGSYFLGRN